MNKEENIKEYYRKKYLKKKIGADVSYKRKIDIMYRIMNNIKHRAYSYYQLIGITHRQLLGCNIDELKEYLEKQLKDGMTFENYGEWEIDHIKPLDSFDLTKESNIRECFHYKNMQPLWLTENRRKGHSY